MFQHVNLKLGKEDSDTQTITVDEMRFYRVVIDNETHFFPSVTTVTGYTKRKFFDEWSKNPKNKQRRDAATSRGDAIHHSIEKYLLNQEDYLNGIDAHHADIILLMKPFLDKHINNIHALEYPMYSTTAKLAGRVDCVAEFDGELSIIDFKGSFYEKKEENIQNYFEQGTAYALMWEEMFHQKIENVVIIIGCETGTVQIIKKKVKDMLPYLAETVKSFWKSVDPEIFKNNLEFI